MATTYEEVLNLFKAVVEAQRDTERLLREQTQETDRKFQDTDRKFQNTDRKFQNTDRKIKAVTTAIGDLGNRLGEFVEGMVRPAVVRLFRERGIAVHEVHTEVEVPETTKVSKSTCWS